MRNFLSCAKAISDETRVRILKLLEERELCVCQLMEILGMGQSTVSKHLGILRNAGLVDARKDGTWTFYRVADEAVNDVNLAFNDFVRKALDDDDRVAADLRRARAVLKKPLSSICSVRPDSRIPSGKKRS